MDTLLSQLPLLLGMPDASAAAGGAGAGGQFVSLLVTFGLIIVIFYFLIIRPQSKKQKETKKMLESIKKGDRVVTIGGLHGQVQTVRDDVVILKVDDEGTTLMFNRSAVATVTSQAEGETPKGGKGKNQTQGTDGEAGEAK